jgi:hypothetical protein
MAARPETGHERDRNERQQPQEEVMSGVPDPRQAIAAALDRIDALNGAEPAIDTHGEIAAAVEEARTALAALSAPEAGVRPDASHPESGHGPTSYTPRTAR